MLRVTVDSNVLSRAMDRIRQAAHGLDVEVLRTTVTLREQKVTKRPEESVVIESGVWGESPWGEFLWGGGDAGQFEAILEIIGSGSFPKLGQRDSLSAPRTAQLRDAMILEAHTRDDRDILVSDDVTGFGSNASSPKANAARVKRRQQLEELCGTMIMTVDEVCSHLEALAR